MNGEENVSRKEFLKLSGVAALFGIGGPAVFEIVAQSTQGAQSDFSSSPAEAINKIRYGMVVDTRKCKEGCADCAAACHFYHNVPDHKSKKIEVKWLWKSPRSICSRIGTMPSRLIFRPRNLF